jgi:hypothetical protein
MRLAAVRAQANEGVFSGHENGVGIDWLGHDDFSLANDEADQLDRIRLPLLHNRGDEAAIATAMKTTLMR